VLNNRRLLRRPPVGPDAPSPGPLVAQLLHNALALHQRRDSDDYSSSTVMAFLDCTVALQGVDLDDMSNHQQLAFWLNLYHCMLLHALLFVGPPTSTRTWPSWFSSNCYEVAGTVVSLAEVEHCILRRPMSQPATKAGLIQGIYPEVPKWHEDDPRQRFALPYKEPRINFVLNCASVSYPNDIMVFAADNIEAQLNEASSRFILKTVQTVSVSKIRREIVLPKVCEWYTDDFGFTTLDCVRYIQTYISEQPVGSANKKELLELSLMLNALLPEAPDIWGRTKEKWEGTVKFGSMRAEFHQNFTEHPQPNPAVFTEQQHDHGMNRFV